MRRSRLIVFAVVAVTLAGAAACGLDQGGVLGLGESPDGSILDGAALDGQIGDGQITDAIASGDGGSKDGSPDADSSTPFDAGVYFCGPIPVANCAIDCPPAPHNCPSSNICISSCFPTCLGYTFQCDACGTDGGVALSRCEPEDASAYAECLVGLNRCACPSNNVSACPGTNQTCENNECFECAEPDAGAGQIGDKCEKGPSNTCHADGTCQ